MWDLQGSVIFFVSYVLIAWGVLLNIVVAVLLDELFQKMAKRRATDAKEAAEALCTPHCLDPLMTVLADSESMEELRTSITSIFASLDADASGAIGFEEMREGLPKMLEANDPAAQDTDDDWLGLGDWPEVGDCAKHADPVSSSARVRVGVVCVQCPRSTLCMPV